MIIIGEIVLIKLMPICQAQGKKKCKRRSILPYFNIFIQVGENRTKSSNYVWIKNLSQTFIVALTFKLRLGLSSSLARTIV